MKVKIQSYPTNYELEYDQKENEGARWYVMGLCSSIEAMQEIHQMFKS